ncbi:hypothetical protein ElyMa_002276700 [Elysia marginata]|uniref:Uncharacterized protein n=1 Tax=Elysia marginata TaxID=1093978 RepID=A0AAV4FZR1_9GAST|nr:hypothetical protein ElyMa_002276700 [Elysia marginata]
MGLWQLMAAATALNVTIVSVYPQKGSSCGRFLNRTISPVPDVSPASAAKRTIVILWTSTQSDMADEHWVPNHLEPMIPLAEPLLYVQTGRARQISSRRRQHQKWKRRCEVYARKYMTASVQKWALGGYREAIELTLTVLAYKSMFGDDLADQHSSYYADGPF